MRLKTLALICGSLLCTGTASAQRHSRVWFDTPNPSVSVPVWGTGEVAPNAGSGFVNPDRNWEHHSLPIGNGNIGANIIGSIGTERFTFNEKSLWRGGPNTTAGAKAYWDVNKHSAGVLDSIRQALANGDNELATRLTQENFNSEVPYEPTDENPFRFGSFTTGGEFRIVTPVDEASATGYSRSLSLDSAVAAVSFSQGGVDYKRTFFISYPANVMVVRLTADKPGMQSFTLEYSPNPFSKGKFKATGKDGWLYDGRLDNNSMQYAVRVKAIADGGKTRIGKDGRLTVDGANEVMLLITIDTDYKINFDPDFNDPKTYVGVNPVKTTGEWIDAASRLSYNQLLAEHYADYSALYDRTSLEINPGINSELDQLPTPARLDRYRTGAPDYGLESLYFDFGRYLLIASSRPGNLPANLQGVWHNHVDGPWRVDYHNNINLQMNYWPALPTNLAECQEPLTDFIRSQVKPGEVTAANYFGARGWTTSISSNPFGFTTPLSSHDMSWNFTPVAGPWLATHIWDYYDYTRDLDYLRNNYDIIKGSADFAVDHLWHRPDGSYTAAPSTSPEHGPIDLGTAFAHSVIRQILTDAIAASEVLGEDENDRKQWQEVLANIPPLEIGRYGQLMEWSADIDNPLDEHRHVNHLFGLYPGNTISPVTTPKLAKGARTALEHRGDGATGWSMGWKLNLWARLLDGNRAYRLYGNLLKNGTNDNLWDSHPPFQIDGNFGGTAGIAEMLVQSHPDFIQILPALPDVWHDGSLSGIRTRGNFTIDIAWHDNNLTEAKINSGSGGPCTLLYKGDRLTFDTAKGKSYTVTYRDGKLALR